MLEEILHSKAFANRHIKHTHRHSQTHSVTHARMLLPLTCKHQIAASNWLRQAHKRPRPHLSSTSAGAHVAPSSNPPRPPTPSAPAGRPSRMSAEFVSALRVAMVLNAASLGWSARGGVVQGEELSERELVHKAAPSKVFFALRRPFYTRTQHDLASFVR
jgi:hypothetical protein